MHISEHVLDPTLRDNARLLAMRAETERIVKRGVPALAFVDHPLPDDALAIILLDQAEQHASRYIVIERQTFSDDVLDRALALCMRWQRDNPTVEEPAAITLYRDGRYEGHAGEVHQSGVQEFRRMGVPREIMSRELLERAEATSMVTIPRFGKVRLVPLT
jgi:hypothetical protein